MNLNQAAHYVANAFHKEFDNELIERIKDSIRNKAAKYMYQRANSGENLQYFTITFSSSLILFNEEEPCDVVGNCNWLRTENPIPVQLALRIGAPFHNIRTAKGVPLTYISRSQYLNVRFNKTVRGQLFYLYENNHILIPNARKLNKITIETISFDVDKIPYLCSEECITDDHEFPLPSHIWDYVLNEVKQEIAIEFKIPTEQIKPLNITDEA